MPGTGPRAASLVARVTTAVGWSRLSLRRWLGLQAPAAVTSPASWSFLFCFKSNPEAIRGHDSLTVEELWTGVRSAWPTEAAGCPAPPALHPLLVLREKGLQEVTAGAALTLVVGLAS